MPLARIAFMIFSASADQPWLMTSHGTFRLCKGIASSLSLLSGIITASVFTTRFKLMPEASSRLRFLQACQSPCKKGKRQQCSAKLPFAYFSFPEILLGKLCTLAIKYFMTRDWEEQFREWAKPPGKTEQDRCDNAVSAIRNALDASEKLSGRVISVFAQGSYRNNTNVRSESDVDIGVLCTNTLLNDFPPGKNRDDFGLIPADYHYAQYKNEVEEALVAYFGRSAVKRGNKALDIHETSYHVEADVAPFFEHRRYREDGTYLEGVALLTDKEKRRINNWPEQHYENGVWKNKQTGMRFKSLVRVLKALSSEMTEAAIGAGNIPGFLVECLVWNVPDDHFQHESYSDDVRAALIFLYNNTLTSENCKELGEVSDLIYLFHSGQKWTREQANAFILAAWNYVGFQE